LKTNKKKMFFPAAKKSTLKCGGNQDEKSRDSGEK
jgi:hypothetical protein